MHVKARSFSESVEEKVSMTERYEATFIGLSNGGLGWGSTIEWAQQRKFDAIARRGYRMFSPVVVPEPWETSTLFPAGSPALPLTLANTNCSTAATTAGSLF